MSKMTVDSNEYITVRLQKDVVDALCDNVYGGHCANVPLDILITVLVANSDAIINKDGNAENSAMRKWLLDAIVIYGIAMKVANVLEGKDGGRDDSKEATEIPNPFEGFGESRN